MSKLYAIVDIETTGTGTTRDKITEIAIVHHDGSKITGSYSTLINPQCSISSFITGLTGITNEMVSKAPKFYEIAKEIIEWTEGRIFVAHNVHFDYGFIKEEFKSLGFTFTRQTLDTVRLSRLAFPGHKSYSLSNLIQRLNIQVKDRHRALADAMATAEIFGLIMDSGSYTGSIDNFITMGIKTTNLPIGISLNYILNLPESHGVYYLKNNDDALIYIGKSKNIKNRIAQHFTQHSEKSTKIRQRTHSIDFQLTGNELASLIKESIEIRQFKPLFNKTQRTPSFPYVVIQSENDGIPQLIILKSKDLTPHQKCVKYFTHKKLAENFISNKLFEIGNLLEQNFTFGKIDNPLYRKSLLSNEAISNDIESFKRLFFETIEKTRLWFDEDYVLEAEGRNPTEKCLFLIKDGRFYGFNYIDSSVTINGIDDLTFHIEPTPYHPELDQLIHTYLKKSTKNIKVIKL